MAPLSAFRRWIAPVLVVVVAALGGCGGGGTTDTVGGGDTPPAGGTSPGGGNVPQGPAIVADYYVDADGGSDAGPGTWDDPFETITHALSVAQAGESIHAYPGTYDTANGEVFPLVIPDSVELIGNEDDQGAGSTPTLIRGGAPIPPQYVQNLEAAVVLQEASVLAGFAVTNPNPYTSLMVVGISFLRSDAEVRNTHVVDCLSAGLYFGKASTGGAITGNVIARCNVGIYLAYGPNDGRVEENLVTQNKTGAWCLYAEPDLGGGVSGSLGGNRIIENSGRDLMASSNRTIAAQGNYWDNAPPIVETGVQTIAGADVYEKDNTATVDTTGALLNTEVFTIPTFP